MVELHWTSDGERVVTASPDKSVRAWDVASGQQVKKMAEHDSFVNSCCPLRRGPPLLVSGSDDGTAKVGTSKKEHAAFAAGRAATAIVKAEVFLRMQYPLKVARECRHSHQRAISLAGVGYAGEAIGADIA